MSIEIEAKGQCAWCLQRDRQAFALICPEHVNSYRNLLDELQRDIQALCRAVGEFDGARPESPQVLINICAKRAQCQLAALQAAKGVLDCIAINGPGDYIVAMAHDALAQIHKAEKRQRRQRQDGEQG